MEVGKLSVSLRHGRGKGPARRLRAHDLVPAVCYGDKLEKPLAITLDPKELKASLDPEKRANTVIEMEVLDGDKSIQTIKVMLKEYQIDSLRRNVTHVDLVAIDPEKTVHVEVPIDTVGRPLGVRVGGGQTLMVRHSLHVTCKPTDIPAKLVLDIENLDVGQALHLSDLTMPEGVTLVESEKLAIINCIAPLIEEEVETTETDDDEAEVEADDPAKK